jgi:hypothetical protein
MTNRPRVLRLFGGLALGTAVALAGVAPVTAADGYRQDVARPADFVAQTNFVQCVGASLQMMINMIEPGRDRSAREQLRLQKLARKLSPPRRDGSIRQGASVRGWVKVLHREVDQPYRLVGADSLNQAVRMAARAIDRTGAPVGLLVWRGRHAWVMSGFEATADPRETDAFEVTGIRVHDPLYPHGSTVWGTSPKPNSLISPATLAEQFVLRDSTRVNLGVPPGYLLVLPVAAEA